MEENEIHHLQEILIHLTNLLLTQITKFNSKREINMLYY